MSLQRSNRRSLRWRAAVIVLGVLAAFLLANCGPRGDGGEEETLEKKTTKTVSEVLQHHRDQLMSLPGVVGVAQGRTEDGRDCIVVMLKEDNPDLRAQIPALLEGYPVQIKITGEFRALGTQ